MSGIRDFDWKLIGYALSSVSVGLLGAAAWPGADRNWWHMPALYAGMLLSVFGMASRYVSHRIDQRKIEEAKHRNGR